MSAWKNYPQCGGDPIIDTYENHPEADKPLSEQDWVEEFRREVESNEVNKPKHYTSANIETIDLIEATLSKDEFRGFLRGNIFKYQSRYQLKGGIKDLKKAAWYNNRLIKLEESA